MSRKIHLGWLLFGAIGVGGGCSAPREATPVLPASARNNPDPAIQSVMKDSKLSEAEKARTIANIESAKRRQAAQSSVPTTR